MTTDPELIAENLHKLGIDELEPARRYHCRVCDTTWQYRPLPYWWRCPTPGCTDWMARGGPGVESAMRQLSGRRPAPVARPAGKPAAGRSGRPQRPTVAPERIREVFNRLQDERGHYPTDADLAEALQVEPRTVQNYRTRGYLPPRPIDEQARPRK